MEQGSSVIVKATTKQTLFSAFQPIIQLCNQCKLQALMIMPLYTYLQFFFLLSFLFFEKQRDETKQKIYNSGML